MSRKLIAVLYALVVLAGAMGLKTLVTQRHNGPVLIAVGGAPVPIR